MIEKFQFKLYENNVCVSALRQSRKYVFLCGKAATKKCRKNSLLYNSTNHSFL